MKKKGEWVKRGRKAGYQIQLSAAQASRRPFFFLLNNPGRAFIRQGGIYRKRGGKFTLPPSRGSENNDHHPTQKKKGRNRVPSDPALTFFCVGGWEAVTLQFCALFPFSTPGFSNTKLRPLSRNSNLKPKP